MNNEELNKTYELVNKVNSTPEVIIICCPKCKSSFVLKRGAEIHLCEHLKEVFRQNLGDPKMRKKIKKLLSEKPLAAIRQEAREKCEKRREYLRRHAAEYRQLFGRNGG